MNTTVTQEQIDELLNNAETQEHVFWGKELLVSYKIRSGFTITGRAAVVDPSRFDIEIGRDIARKDAERQLWAFEGYVLQGKLHQETETETAPKQWKPKQSEQFYYPRLMSDVGYGYIIYDKNDIGCHILIDCGLAFRTPEEAAQRTKEIRAESRLRNFLLNHPQHGWGICSTSVCYESDNDRFAICHVNEDNPVQFKPQWICASQGMIEDMIANHDADLRIYFGVKENLL